jgi:hypothetical protein
MKKYRVWIAETVTKIYDVPAEALTYKSEKLTNEDSVIAYINDKELEHLSMDHVEETVDIKDVS